MAEKKATMRRQVPARLLAAAGELFSAQGYHGTSMREIADKARVLVGSIYNHFDDKEAIFRAVLRNQRPFGQALDAIADAEGQSAEALLRDAGKRLTATFDSNPGLLNLLFIDMVEFDGKHLLELYDDDYVSRVEMFARRVESADGAIRPLSAESLFHSLLNMVCFAYIVRRRLASAGLGSRTALSDDDFIDIYLHGVSQADR